MRRSCPIACAREGSRGCLLPPPPPPPDGPGCSRNTRRGTCADAWVDDAAASRVFDRGHALSDITIEMAARWNITEAIAPFCADRARFGTRGAANARHKSDRRAPDRGRSRASKAEAASGGIGLYSHNPSPLTLVLRTAPCRSHMVRGSLHPQRRKTNATLYRRHLWPRKPTPAWRGCFSTVQREEIRARGRQSARLGTRSGAACGASQGVGGRSLTIGAGTVNGFHP